MEVFAFAPECNTAHAQPKIFQNAISKSRETVNGVRSVHGVTITPLGVQAGETIQDCGFGVLEVWQA
jgi:hypothetical protein